MNEIDDLPTYCQMIAGISINHLIILSGVPRRTLYDWWKTKRRVVELIVQGLKYEKDNFKNENFNMNIEHTDLKVLIRDNQPLATLSRQTFVNAEVDGSSLSVTLHHKVTPFGNQYADHIYRVSIKENKHLLTCLDW
jgi:hypothetical protein